MGGSRGQTGRELTMMRARLFALPLMFALIGASCAPQPDTPASADKHAVEIGPGAAANPPPPPSIQPPPADPSHAPPQTSPVLVVPLSKPGHADAAPATKPSAHTVDYSCRTSADCAVKDVGNCCGQYPACVNKGSPTFPDEVRAQCGKEHRMGVCGFPSISGCECVHGKCSDITGISNSSSAR
jgi:hypothetical protein